MTHYFDTEEAKKYEILGAVILANIRHWCLKNKANDRHLYDGRYWTYNSLDAFQKLFPYATVSQIRRSLTILEEAKAIFVGNYNSITYDRTKWYSVPEALENAHFSSGTNRFDSEHKPIPDINTYNKQEVTGHDKSEQKSGDFTDKSVTPSLENNLYQKAVAKYLEFLKIKLGRPGLFDGSDGKSMKQLLKYLKDSSKSKDDDGAYAGLCYILDNWSLLDEFYDDKIKVRAILSNVNNIISLIKGAKSKSPNKGEGVTAPAYRKL